ncbi:MAG: MerR family transcriptional regulator [Desulfovibrio sp.]|jgi:DNA-binding transcriptional MerR regulator|nr:MerR family transcriptional regulator [Desulfovibrio sp.]
MRIGELARRTGCKAVTIRFYEAEGLLPAPERSGANYRDYGDADLDRLEFVMHCRRHGMGLEEIRRLLVFREHPQRDCTWICELVGERIRQLDRQIASLGHLKGHLQRMLDACDGSGDGEGCGVMRMLNDRGACCAACDRCDEAAAAASGEPPRHGRTGSGK